MSATVVDKPDVRVSPLSMEHLADAKPGANEVPAPAARRRHWPWLAVAVLAVAAGGGWYAYTRVAASAKNETGQAANAASDGQRVGKATLGFVAGGVEKQPSSGAGAARLQTVPVEVVQRSDMLRLTGSLIADERSSVASNTSGIAAEVRVDRGSIVRKGDVLVQIDATDAKNRLAEGQAMLEELKTRLGVTGDMDKFNPEDQPEVRLAKASADLAASNLRRSQELIAKKVISNESYDQTRTEYELATQRYRQARLLIRQAYQACQTAMTKLAILEKAVDDTTIRAPFDGWVAEKLVAVGEQISSGMQATKVVTLVRVDPLRLSLTVPQQDIDCVKVGQTVRFHVDSFPDQTFDATVRFIAPVVTNDTRSMVVEAIVRNPEGSLRPGLFATAELELAKKGEELLLPVSAVQKSDDVARVFVVRNGAAREQVVALGEVEGGKVQIKSGLAAKDVVIARPELVRDGDAVRQ